MAYEAAAITKTRPIRHEDASYRLRIVNYDQIHLVLSCFPFWLTYGPFLTKYPNREQSQGRVAGLKSHPFWLISQTMHSALQYIYAMLYYSRLLGGYHGINSALVKPVIYYCCQGPHCLCLLGLLYLIFLTLRSISLMSSPPFLLLFY